MITNSKAAPHHDKLCKVIERNFTLNNEESLGRPKKITELAVLY